MDFDKAAERLARDQKQLRGRAVGRNTAPSLSAKAKREAEMRRKQQERMAVERQKKHRQAIAMRQYMTRCERNLGVRALSNEGRPLTLKPTSIHGDGDKIALPVSVLEFLTNAGIETSPDSPWIFRIAIPNPAYTFPTSTLLQQKAAQERDEEDDDDDDDDDDAMEHDGIDEDNDEDDSVLEAFLDELSYKYLAYTHGSVVEFTQEEGHIGLPHTTAAALISQSGDAIPTCKTVDPAMATTENTKDEEELEKTPGHLAWGAFEVPNSPVEVSLVKLPKGKACTLQPTEEAILNGFYNLKDIKLVLEQSLIRTRATLSVNDVVHSWHRGVKYDLRVADVKPATYKAVVCINTDINVDFTAPPSTGKTNEEEFTTTTDEDTGRMLGSTTNNDSRTLSGGRTLGSEPTPMPSDLPTALATMDVDLIPEPPAEQKEDVCTIQIRGDGANGRRRFDVHQSTLQDVFAFASTIVSTREFRLVSRFPRRVFAPGGEEFSSTLASLGLPQGQEVLMVERI